MESGGLYGRADGGGGPGGGGVARLAHPGGRHALQQRGPALRGGAVAPCQGAVRTGDCGLPAAAERIAPRRTREQEVAECCRKLKALARKLDCPVIISSQLNRQSEGMPARMPELSHLRESGAIEQDSDMVVLLYRPERCRMRVYGERKLPTEGMLVAIVAKHRNGRTGELIFRHNPAMTRMCDWPDV